MMIMMIDADEWWSMDGYTNNLVNCGKKLFDYKTYPLHVAGSITTTVKPRKLQEWNSKNLNNYNNGNHNNVMLSNCTLVDRSSLNKRLLDLARIV